MSSGTLRTNIRSIPIRRGIMLEVGVKAPAFSLQDQDGNTVSLEDFKGQKVLLWFYPKASTPGCTAEGCNL